MPTPPKVIFRQPKNLQSLIVRAKVSSRSTPVVHRGTFKTHARNCVTCSALRETTHVVSHTTGERFHLNTTSTTCTTKEVIYLINCLDCGKQYVGETGSELKVRHRGHRQEFRKCHTPLGFHFQTCQRCELIGLQNLTNSTKQNREEAELKWIYRLKTYAPLGINVKDMRH
ncbi:hypothetical protein HOLleu_39720 [Holothuria leucospilota]|uniref:GIY-YIG domain-containing protein n=1 Tax=Holothuria leucospilota TaxID=206669 RepID=A0A9Q1BB53_HOLLE|nr:hypothetical protein HOLleu_39720 [Holothuria leucospilota]